MALKTLGRLQKGDPDSAEFAFYGFAGLNVKDVGQMLSDEDLTVAVNGYLTTAGGFQMRNGMGLYGAAFPSGSVYLARFYQGVVNGATVTPVATLLAQNAGNLYVAGAGSNTLVGSIGGTNAGPMTTARFQDPNDPNYTSGLTDVIVICTGSGGPYVYDGTHLYTPSGWGLAAGASWCAIVNGILWFGGIPAYPNQIFGTGDGIIASMETLPGYRNFVMSVPVTGLCAIGTGATAFLLIGLNNGVAVLSGTGPSNFYEQELPLNDGVVAGRTMCAWNGTGYFLGRNAVYAFNPNGAPAQISQKIEPWILNLATVPGPPLGFPLAFSRSASWMKVYNNRLHLGYASGGTPLDTVLVYDLVVNGWTVLQTTPGLADMCLLDAPNDPSPYQCVVGTTGITSTPGIRTWDVTQSPGAVALDAQPGAAGVPVIALVQTKYFKLGVPGTNKALQRFYPEFFVSGMFKAAFTLSADYGLNQTNVLFDQPSPTTGALFWDSGMWDADTWASPLVFVPFGPPQTRIDYPGVQADSYAFGVQMLEGLPPWIFAGGSGVYTQRGRT